MVLSQFEKNSGQVRVELKILNYIDCNYKMAEKYDAILWEEPKKKEYSFSRDYVGMNKVTMLTSI